MPEARIDEFWYEAERQFKRELVKQSSKRLILCDPVFESCTVAETPQRM